MNHVITNAKENEWTTVRLKTLLKSAQNGVWGAEPRGDGSDTLCIRVADFDRDKLTVTEQPTTYRYVEKKDLQGRTVRTGDLLLEKSGGGDKTLVGMAVQYRGNEVAVCSNFVSVVRPRAGVSADWLNYLFFSLYSRRINYRSIKQSTGIQNLDSGSYFDERVPVPSTQTQVAIATALDRETARIDALIEKKTRFIELLKEKRQALITQAVTKGLDPTVPMKDSGVEWISDVPAHWRVMGLTKCIGPIVDYRGRTPTKVDEGQFLVTAKNVRAGKLDYECSKEYVDPKSAKQLLERGKPEIGDLLFTMEAPLGEVALIDRTDIALAQRIVKFRGMPSRLKNEFLLYWIMGTYCQSILETLSTGSTALGIKASKLGMIPVFLPPLEEQGEVVQYLEQEFGRIDALMAATNRSTELLKERRSALITAAVTGQIDLREDAA